MIKQPLKALMQRIPVFIFGSWLILSAALDPGVPYAQESDPAALLGPIKLSVLEYEKELGLFVTGAEEAPEAVADSSYDEWLQGRQMYKLGVYDKAIPILLKLAEAPGNDRVSRLAWETLQKIYYETGEHQEAIKVFIRISSDRKTPPGSESVFFAGNSYLKIGEPRSAVRLLTRVPEKSPEYPFALYSLALAYIGLDELESSVMRPLEKLIKINPKKDRVLAELINRARITAGRYLMDKKKYAESERMFNSVRPESHFYPAAVYGTGLSMAQGNNCIKAIVVFEDLSKQHPYSPFGLEARTRVGSCYAALTAYRTAVKRFQEALAAFEAEKEFLDGLNNRIAQGEEIFRSDLQDRISHWDGGMGSEGIGRWVEYNRELAQLQKRINRIEEGWKVAGGGKTRGTLSVGKLRLAMDQVNTGLSVSYRHFLAGQILQRLQWIEAMTEQTRLQLTKNVIRIQTDGTIP